MDHALLIQLSAYADGELNAGERRAVEQQLAQHPELARELELHKRLDRAAADLPEPRAAWAGWVSPAAAEAAPELKCLEASAAIPAPTVSPEKFDRVWRKIAAQTVAPPEEDRRAMRLSAIHDGEENDQPEAQGADAEKLRRIWARLDAAAAALPVPELKELAAEELFAEIAQRTVAVSAADQRAWTRLDQAAAEMTPEVAAETWDKVWAAIARRTLIAVPAVSEERWQGVWQGIQNRIEKSKPAARAQAEAGKAVAVDFQRPHRHPWRWIIAAGVAAALALVVMLPRSDPLPDEGVAMEIPEPLDDRYQVSVKYVEGQKQPVLCFFLKDEPKAEPKPANWRWLPY